jgi:hypothetical protein
MVQQWSTGGGRDWWSICRFALPRDPTASVRGDLSASGAYIKVCADLRLLSRVQIALALPHRLTHPTPMVAAYIARNGKDGVGVEWCDYAPKAVLELLRYAAAHRHDRPRTESGRYVPAANPLDEPKSLAEA